MAFEDSSAQIYHDRARRVREMAAEARLPEIREQLLMMADEYDAMAGQPARASLGRRRIVAQQHGPGVR